MYPCCNRYLAAVVCVAMPNSTGLSRDGTLRLFQEACAAGDVSGARRALRRQPHLAQDWKALMDACFVGDAAIVGLLLEADADANQRSPNSYRHLPLVRATEWKRTSAKHDGHCRVVELLLQHGADPSLPGGLYPWRPVSHAAMCGHPGLTQLLGQPAESREGAELHVAAMLLEEVRTKKLCESRDPNGLDESGHAPLHGLAASGMHEPLGSELAVRVAQWLLSAGASIDPIHPHPLRTEQPTTPLWWAIAWRNHLPLARCLLEHGANPSSAVHAAATEGHADALALLLAHGADINHRLDGQTPLQQMICFKRPRLLGPILEAGADPNAVDPDGCTTLHLAVRAGLRTEALAMLLRHDADPSLLNRDGQTPRDMALALRRTDAAALFGAPPRRQTRRAARTPIA